MEVRLLTVFGDLVTTVKIPSVPKIPLVIVFGSRFFVKLEDDYIETLPFVVTENYLV